MHVFFLVDSAPGNFVAAEALDEQPSSLPSSQKEQLSIPVRGVLPDKQAVGGAKVHVICGRLGNWFLHTVWVSGHKAFDAFGYVGAGFHSTRSFFQR